MRTAHAAIIAALAVWLVGSEATAEPAKAIKPPVGEAKPLPPKKAAPVPKLAAKCQFGDITQTGDEFYISGGEWVATGKIRQDGKVAVLWVYQGEGAPAIYDIVGGKLIGRWGWTKNGAQFDGKGELLNATSPETLRNPDGDEPEKP